jgi:hypothetical protein
LFLDAIRQSGQPALDVACGTGRRLLVYLGQGIDISRALIWFPAPEALAMLKEAGLGNVRGVRNFIDRQAQDNDRSPMVPGQRA